MNTSFIAMALAILMGFGFLIGLGALSLLTGALHFLFIKPKFHFLKSQHDKEGFAFGFSWNHSAEEVRFNTLKIHLFNPFGSPTELEITRDFAPHDQDFAMDLNLGPKLLQLISAKGFEQSTIEIEVSATKDGITHVFPMKGIKFLENFRKASESASDFNLKHQAEKIKPIYTSAPERTFISPALPKSGKALKLATNPEFAGQFAGGASDVSAATAVANYAVSKIWIAPGCIVCDACEAIFPEVFEVTDTTCLIRPGAPLNDGLRVQEAAEACPVEVIKFTRI